MVNILAIAGPPSPRDIKKHFLKKPPEEISSNHEKISCIQRKHDIDILLLPKTGRFVYVVSPKTWKLPKIGKL